MKMPRSTAFPFSLARTFALATFLLFAAAIALAQQQAVVANSMAPAADPPARVGTLTAAEGSVVFAPAGESDWVEMPRNRPITRGDRLWTDDGARAEVHFGSAVLHMDSRTFLEVVSVDDDVVQVRVNEGVVNARVREIRAGDNFEIDTPQLALRVTEPGDWRMDVDPQRGFTRVAVRSGMAVVYGAGGGAQQIAAGQQMAFAGRDLAQANAPQLAGDGFERWAMDRNRAEDQSIAARYIPRDVVGYQELDRNGTWANDATYGTVWYPQAVAADWAPYRYGRWEWIAPWGWTWIDDAPWGFAPFHYGRWATIGSRWAWVPGPLGRRPVYSPALVAFVGGGSGVSFSFSSGPGIGWYPLAPGEIWQPYFAASPVYVRNVNRYVVTNSRYYNNGTHYYSRRPEAITAVRVDDFNRGRPVHQRWTRVNAGDVARVQPVAPPMPAREWRREQRELQTRVAPPPVQRWTPPPTVQQPQPREERREFTQRPPQQQWREQQRDDRQAVREQERAQREHQQRAFQQQQLQQQRAVQHQQQQREQQARQQQWREQRDNAMRQQQEAAQRQQAEAARQQQQAAREMQRQQHQQQQQQQAWHAQQQAQRQQQHLQAQQQRHIEQQQQQQQRRAERSERQAQRDDEGHGRGRGRRYE